jgi:proteasome assembly chaperone (PAC2) family protein
MAEGLYVTAAELHEASRFLARRMSMDEVEFHREPPSNIPTMVTAFGGWIDAGEAATGAMRSLVRQLAAVPLAAIDPEDFFDFTQVRPVVRLTAEGERIIRWPRNAFWLWQPEGGAGLLLFRGLEPQRRWRTYATLLLDVAARCGVQRIVSLGAVLAAVPHTRPPRVTGSSTDPTWQARLEACGMLTRRSRYEGPTGIATIVMDAAQRRGMASCNVRGQAPHYLQRATNPAVSRALLTAVSCLLDLELDLSPFAAAVQAFRTQCDQAVAQDAAVQAYVRQLEQDYDATGDETPRRRRDDDFHPEQLMHELEDFLRQERERGAE